MPMVCDMLQPNPSTPFTSDNESHPMEKRVLIKYISHLNPSPYQSIPDDGVSEFPKFNLYRI
jgi:hypothetical protein